MSALKILCLVFPAVAGKYSILRLLDVSVCIIILSVCVHDDNYWCDMVQFAQGRLQREGLCLKHLSSVDSFPLDVGFKSYISQVSDVPKK